MSTDAWGHSVASPNPWGRTFATPNTFFTPKGEVPFSWRKGCIEAHAQSAPLAGLAAVGLENSTGEHIAPREIKDPAP